MGLLTAKISGAEWLGIAAEAGIGIVGGAVVLLAATPEGRQWLAGGCQRAARGAAIVSGAIGSLFADLKHGWGDLIQEVRDNQSAASAGPEAAGGGA